MLSTITLVLASFLLIVTNAIPIIKHEQGFEYGGLERTFSSDYPSKKQLVLHGPEISHDLPPYSEGVFDSFGHHLTGHMNPGCHTGHLHPAAMVHIGEHRPYKIHHHEYQFHAPDIDYWWPYHWPPHLPPPFPFHKQKGKKKEDEKKEKEKEKDKKKGKQGRK